MKLASAFVLSAISLCSMFAFAVESEIIARGKNVQEILCLMESATPINLRDRVNDVYIYRVTAGSAIKYEIFNASTGDMVAGCNGFILK